MNLKNDIRTYEDGIARHIYIVTAFYYTALIILYSLYLWIDYTNLLGITNIFATLSPDLLKITSVFLCFCYIVYLFIHSNKAPRYYYLLTALFLTCFADILLLFTTNYIAGILLFTVIQICYLCFIRGRKGLISHFIFCTYTCGIVTCLLYSALSDTMFFQTISRQFSNLFITIWCGMVYFTYLTTNIVLSCKSLGKNTPQEGNWLFIGLIFMFLCDFHVAAYNILCEFTFPPRTFLSYWLYFSRVGMWLFYLPSLFCIIEFIRSRLSAENPL